MADKKQPKQTPKQPPKPKTQSQLKQGTDRSKRFISSNPDDMFG